MLKLLEILAVAAVCIAGVIAVVCMGVIFLMRKLFDDEIPEDETYL